MFLWNVLTDLSVLSADNVETELVSKSLNLVLFSSFVCVSIVNHHGRSSSFILSHVGLL